MALNIPIKTSAAEARALIAQKMDKDKGLTMAEKRQLEDQYQQYGKGYAKGGDITKGKTMATKKKSPAKGATWDGVKDHEFGFTIGQPAKELMGNRQPKGGPKVQMNVTIKKTKFADGGVASTLTPKQTKKVGAVMHEFKTGTLHSGKGGKVVTNPKQGIAIALSEASRMKKKK